MPYYIVGFSATLEGSTTETGIIRISGAYNPNVTKKAIERYYRTKRPTVRNVAIVIISKDEVTKDQYDIAAKDSIDA